MQALIFDFDGLIIDSETPEYESWLAVYRAYGADLPIEFWAGLIGKSSADASFDPYAHLEAQIGKPVDRAAIRQQRHTHFRSIFDQQDTLPGVRARMAEAQERGLKLGVASSGTRDWVQSNLERLGLMPFLGTVATADDVPRAKPDPAVYLLAAQQLDVSPNQCIVLEDSRNGLLAAKAAGMFAVAIPNTMTQHLDLSIADLQLDSLASISLSALIARAQQQP